MTLFFDRIYRGSAADEKFNDVKPILNSFLAGGISCVLNHGTTGSGKKCTMFGANGSNGLLHRSGEYILNSTPFKASAFEFMDKGCFDLSEKRVLLDEKNKPKGKNISTVDDFKRFVDHFTATRTQKPTNQNATSSRSHLFVVFSLENSDSKMAFVDLAGFESPNSKENSEESKYINSSLSALTSVLIGMTQNQNPKPNKADKMGMYLKPFLITSNQTLIMYHVNNVAPKKGLGYIKDIASSARESKRRNAEPLSNITNKMPNAARCELLQFIFRFPIHFL